MILVAALIISHAGFLNADHGPALYNNEWTRAVTRFDHYVHPFKHQFIKQLDEISISDEIRISPDCKEGLQNFSSGLKNGRLRETIMFDSFSNVAPGMISSLAYNMGSYYQCVQHGRYVYLGIEFPVPKDPSVEVFTSDPRDNNNWMIYYSRSIGFRRADGFHFGICSPQSCDQSDLELIFASKKFKRMITPLTVRIYSTEAKSDQATTTWRQKFGQASLLIIISLGIGSALINVIVPESSVARKLKPFDAYSNAKHLFSGHDVKTGSKSKEESMFANVNLQRWVYLTVGIMGHCITGVNAGSQLFRTETSAAAGEFLAQFATICRDFLSVILPAFLVFNLVLSSCFTTFKAVDMMTKTKVNFFMFLMDRILRLTPMMLVYILFTQSLPLLHNAGPTMQRVQAQNSDLCYRNGWKDLLFINNFDLFKDLCIPFAWFMSVDFQINFFAFPVLLLIARYPQHASKLISCVIVAGIGASGWRFIQNPYPPIFPLTLLGAYDAATNFMIEYYNTLHHIPVYGVGMLLGFKMLQLNGKRRPLTLNLILNVYFREFAFLCVCLATLLCCAAKIIPASTGIHVMLLRTTSASGFAFFFYALFNSESEWLRAASMSRFIVIVSRLSLAWHLAHGFHIMYLMAAQQFIHTNTFLALMDGTFVLVTSFFSACLLHVFVEAPVGRLVSGMKKNLSQKDESK